MSIGTPPPPTHSRGAGLLPHPKYRPDIDGLRAIAVLSVIGFHAFPLWVTGGFIGVDVFFVISGYLISTIIVGSLERNQFSFVEFYSRRIRRIFPALALVLIASLVLGWFVLLPGEYKQLGKHVAGGAGFVSNLVLWNEDGYFDSAAETKPLLHLWSLGIEEQFYIIWPLLLWFAHQKGLNLLAVIVAIAAISFALNIGQSNIDAVGAFYSPQTRFWELLVGSALACVTLRKRNPLNEFQLNLDAKTDSRFKFAHISEKNREIFLHAQSLLGAALIACGVLMITKEARFPGWWALLPTIGALLIISAGNYSWLNRSVLSSRVLVWFGVISYPLYLWHWPLLSFARIVEGEIPSPTVRIAAVAASIVLAWLTYKLLEKPVRFGTHSKLSTISLLVLMVVVGCLGYSCYMQDGREGRAPIAEITNGPPLRGEIVANEERPSGPKVDPKDSHENLGVVSSAMVFGKPSRILPVSVGAETAATSPSKSLPEPTRDFLMSELGLYKYDIKNIYRSDSCFLDLSKKQDYSTFTTCRSEPEDEKKPVLLLWGDSHAAHLYPGYKFVFGKQFKVVQRTAGGCPPILNFGMPNCVEINNRIFEAITKEKPEKVVLAANWLTFDWRKIEATIDELRLIGVENIDLIGPVPHWTDGLPKQLYLHMKARDQLQQIPIRMGSGLNQDVFSLNKLMAVLSTSLQVKYLSPIDSLCNADGCVTIIGETLTTLSAWDAAHLTEAGSIYLVSGFARRDLGTNQLSAKPTYSLQVNSSPLFETQETWSAGYLKAIGNGPGVIVGPGSNNPNIFAQQIFAPPGAKLEVVVRGSSVNTLKATGRVQINWTDPNGKFISASVHDFRVTPIERTLRFREIAPSTAAGGTLYVIPGAQEDVVRYTEMRVLGEAR